MSQAPMDEKREEKEEKEVDKREEKTVEEKWRRDPLGGVAWACILIWAGLVFLADNLGFLATLPVNRFLPPGIEIFRPQVWPIIFLGAGVILTSPMLCHSNAPAI